MAQVKFKSIVLLTGCIFVLLFFHFIPVGLGNVTIVGKQNPEATVETTEENAAIAKKKERVFEQKTGQANLRLVVAGSFDDPLYAVPVRTVHVKN